MFEDLLAEEIQPKEIDINHIPDIEIAPSLRMALQQALVEEEENIAIVSDKTAVVQTDKNFVFFSNQWLYLAVLCKKYAEALKPYGDFYDSEIRGNQELFKVFVSKDYSNSRLLELIPDAEERARFIKFLEPDATFRPGKALLNGDKSRSINDIFG